jgi:hypothetical protein
MKKKDSIAAADLLTHLVSSIVEILQQQNPSTVPQFQCKKILQQRIPSAYTQFQHKTFPSSTCPPQFQCQILEEIRDRSFFMFKRPVKITYA